MRDIAIVVQNENQNVTALDTINAIKENNFKNVFIQWYHRDWKCTQEKQLEIIKELNLNIIFAHLRYDIINLIWSENEQGENVVQEYKNDILSCKNNGIDLVIMHLSSGKTPPKYNEIGLERIKRIVKYAEDLEVRIAFENTRYQGYLEYVLGNIKSKNVGICFDIGHYHTHFKDEFDFNFFKNRIFAVHLHDNDGTGIDQHLLPFDANIKWEKTIKKLVECNYTGPVTLESCYRNDYTKISINEFYKRAFERAEKIAKLFEKYSNI